MQLTHDPRHRPTRPVTAAFIGAAAATVVAGAAMLFGLQPTTELSDEMWRYPWESSGAFVAFSIFSAFLHVLVLLGLRAFGRSGAAGRSRAAGLGVGLAIAGTALLVVGELASIPVRDELTDDVGLVGAIFGIASIASTIGFLVAGRATLRSGVWHDWRRFTPLAVGVWLVVMTPITLAAPTLLHGCVGVYGATLLALAVGLHRDAVPAAAAPAREVQVGPA